MSIKLETLSQIREKKENEVLVVGSTSSCDLFWNISLHVASVTALLFTC